jgi:uncharacterized protein related to proFAR isomerase
MYVLICESVGVLHTTQELANALSMTNRAVLVTHQQGTKVAELLMKLSDLGVEAVIFGRIHFDLGLEVSQPLLLSLSTLQGSNPDMG